MKTSFNQSTDGQTDIYLILSCSVPNNSYKEFGSRKRELKKTNYKSKNSR
jgi:hypothetical protein